MSADAFPFARRWPERCRGVDAHLLFDTPDRLLTLLQLPPHTMVLGYRQLLDQPDPPRPFWGLDHDQRPGIEPLSGAITRVFLADDPELLEAYQAVDQRSGGDGDRNYLDRLQLALKPDLLLQAFCSVGELRGELDHQVRLVQQQREQLDASMKLLQRSQRLLDRSIRPWPEA
ncbi:conserved hypothetical protein [Synechococcus sp. WH 8103]|nr:conserved hypothetical protein [Synechococcus sp. WH 8103]